jgi:predicted NUDIX family NTP pyrophosphohydrolase
MPPQSAGILLFRRRPGAIEFLLIHPGGPFWAKKDAGAWSIPKGEINPGEDPLAAARREFNEETGFTAPPDAIPLTPVRLRSGKLIHAWAAEGDCDATAIRSITFTMEWPPRSGKHADFPEADRAVWFSAAEAKAKLHPAQAPLIDQLLNHLAAK